MHVLALQYAPIWHDKPESQAMVEAMIEAAAPPAGAFVVLPEMSDCGWTMDTEAATRGDSLGWAADLARRWRVSVQLGFVRSVPRDPGFANSTAIVGPDGRVGPVYEKMHPFGFTDEPRHYAAGTEIVVDRVGAFRVAPSICYDLRFPELQRLATAGGAEALSIIANWPTARIAHWRTLVVARAIENQAFVIAVNRVGSDPSHEYGGRTMLVSPFGEILAEAGDTPATLRADFDHAELVDYRARFPALADRRNDMLDGERISRLTNPATDV
ncbi:MAG: hypothetical protein CMJ52_09640 [Planctomycetaceae bacterium]|nr:hypothetical protein [Planctomycetaceae bacterium]